MKRGTTARNIDEYLSKVPEPARSALERLRKTIRAAAPRAEEVISYQIPCVRYQGLLVGFAAFKDHCSFFPMSASLIAANKRALKTYETSKGTIRFPADKPLPAALVRRFVIARIAQNEARKLRKKKGKKLGGKQK